MAILTRARLILLVVTIVLSKNVLLAQPVAGFNIISPVTNCNPAIYSFVNTSTGTGLTYQWNFGVFPGINSVFQNPSTTYLGCGTFQVKLVVTDTDGLKDSSIQTVNIRCSPLANFTTQADSGCLPVSTGFTSTASAGSGSITNYTWDFGDGSSGTGVSPTHTYDVPGCKNVTLIVTNTYNCSSDTTINSSICIYPRPAGNFTSSGQTSCTVPYNVSYQAGSGATTGPYSYQWIFQGGTPGTSNVANPSITYNTSGNFTTTLITTDAHGCSDTLVQANYISIAANDSVNFTIDSNPRCAPVSLVFNGLSSAIPQSWNWTVTAPGSLATATTQNATIAFPDSGSYTVCLNITYSGGCAAKTCSTIVIHNPPVANFGVVGALNTCIVPDVLTFVDSSIGTNLSYVWAFWDASIHTGSTSQVPGPVTYDVCGEYTAGLTVTDGNGCSNSISKPDFLQITCPQANYTVSPGNGCLPLTATFNSTGSTGDPVSWLWNFDDPSSGTADTSTQQNPQHTYTIPGCYTITLTTTTAQGCKSVDSIADGVCAGFKPHANFSANPPENCANKPIFFTDSSTNTYSYTDYYWDFFGGPPYVIQSDSENPYFTYYDVGTYDITLIVSNYGCADTITKDDYVHTVPPYARPRVIRNCSNPLEVTLTGTGSQGADTYLWIIEGNGVSDTATTPDVDNFIFPGPGSYNASLYVTNDSTGCSDLENTIIGVSGFGPQFSGGPLTGCPPMQSCFSNTSVDPVSFAWSITNSIGAVVNISGDSAPCFEFNYPGLYNVQLVITDSSGCIDTLYKPDYISVSQPVANFTGGPVKGCTPVTVNFTDASTAAFSGIAKWDWNFGDNALGANDSSILQDPSHTYSVAGNYSVTLNVTDSNGCTSDSMKVNYILADKLVVNFTSTSSSSCEGTEACFTIDSFSNSTNYQWNFGDGSSSDSANICHLYTTTGSFNATLVGVDTVGCSDTATGVFNAYVVVPHPAFIADTTTTTCPPLSVQFTNLSTGTDSVASWYWQFGDGQVSSLESPFHIYTEGGTYTVTLIATNKNGCTDTLVVSDYINISGPSASVATPPASGCVPDFTCMSVNSASVNTYTWNFGDGTVMEGTDSVCYTYTRSGTFYPALILTDKGGCLFSLPMGEVTVGGTVARFVPDSTFFCQLGTVNFTDSSFGTSAVQSWSWNFGDPASGGQNSSTLQNPSHVFSSPGTYRVTENIVTADGCTDSTADTISIGIPPLPSISISDSSPCGADSILFAGQNASAAPGLTYQWNFDDSLSGSANNSFLQDPVHFYSTPGTYKVTLTEIDASGCSGNNTTVITVNPKPTASFTAFDACLNAQPIIFADSSQGASNFLWSFGDGSNSTEQSPSHTYADTGQFITQLIVQNGFCSDTSSVSINIYPVPTAAFNVPANSPCGTPAYLSFSNNSTGASSYLWNFGNDSSSALVNPVATYLSAGQFSVLLTASNEYSCIDTVSKVVTVNPGSSASFSAYDTCLNTQPIVFTNNSQGANNYLWSFGDGNNSSEQSPSHTYADTGRFVVQLVAQNNFCSDTFSAGVNIYSVPTAAFDIPVNSLCGTPADFPTTNKSVGASSYLWNFGDGDSSTLADPVVTYSSPGQFSILLTAANEHSCFDTTSKTVTINPKPIASFAPVNACLNAQPIIFADSSQGGSVYFWTFGDGGSSDAPNPTHTYADTGSFTTRLIVRNEFCNDTFSASVNIFSVPTAAFSLSDSSLCGVPAQFSTINSSNNASSYFWNFGNESSSTLFAPVITYSSPGQFSIILMVSNEHSCNDTASKNVTVYPNPVVQGLDIGPVEGCQPFTVSLTANATNANSYTWNFGANSSPVSSASSMGSFTYTDTGTYIISLYLTSVNNCQDTFLVPDTVRIHVDPVADFDTLVNSSVYPYDGTVAFINHSQNASSYIWNFGDGSTSTETDPTHRYQQIDVFTISLVATTNYGCSDTMVKSMYVIQKALYVPNALQPDYEGSQELARVWKPIGIGLSSYHAQIFNKWGELMWESDKLADTQPVEAWDGTYEGKPCQQDVYVWKIDAVFLDGTVWPGMTYAPDEGGGTKTIGSVTLVR